jgi:low temperature requirement protein LtrA
LVARDHSEGHRQATWLELLFDLSFVVAVAQASSALEHALARGHAGAGLLSYGLVFAAIWWAWMAFTWFANVFDTDDVPYRLLMMVMIAGSLGLAAGVPRLAELDFRIGVLSYVVMRLAYVTQWARVFWTLDPKWRTVSSRMVVLTTISQVGWVLYLLVPLEWRVPVFFVWFAVDIATPILAGWDARMGGHLGHIVERYGLFTIIVLGESILAATLAIGRTLGTNTPAVPLLVLAGGGLVIVLSLWWIYFDFTTARSPEGDRLSQYLWGYLHYFVFASIAVVGAGLALGAERIADPGHVALTDRGAALVVGCAVATFLVTVALIELTAERERARQLFVKVAGALLALGAAAAAPVLTLPGSVLAVGITLAAAVAWGVALQHRLHRLTAGRPTA